MIASLLLVTLIATQQPSLGVTGLRVEHLTNPLGIDVARPRLSWRITTVPPPRERNIVQAAYQLQVTRNERLIWDTGRTPGDSSVFVVYAGPDLESRRRYAWRVRVWDAKGRVSPWSAPAWWEMGLVQPSDWAAGHRRPRMHAEFAQYALRVAPGRMDRDPQELRPPASSCAPQSWV